MENAIIKTLEAISITIAVLGTASAIVLAWFMPPTLLITSLAIACLWVELSE